jgi:transcriptional regulator with XRE-family HTH domain
MTPFGARLRALREARGVSLTELATALHVSPAYLSALEHGKRGRPTAGLIHQVNEYFGLIWDEADELVALARLSHPRVVLDTAGLSPAATKLANRLARDIRRLPDSAILALSEMLDRSLPEE